MSKTVGVIAFLLIAAGISLCLYRIAKLDAQILPEQIGGEWQVEARALLEDPPSRIRVSLEVPSPYFGANLIEESIRGDGLGAAVLEEKGRRRLLWTGRANGRTQLSLYYRASLRTGRKPGNGKRHLKLQPELDSLLYKSEEAIADDFLKRLRRSKRKPDALRLLISRCAASGDCAGADDLFRRVRKSESKTAGVTAALLRELGVRAYAVKGFFADHAERTARFNYWVRYKQNGQYQRFLPISGQDLDADKLLFWTYLTKLEKRTNEVAVKDIEYSIVRLSPQRGTSNGEAKEDVSKALKLLSFENDPVFLRASYRILLLIPIGALIITVLRTIVGVPMFGTFMPVLIGLAFRETGLMWGLALFSGVVACGVAVRGILGRLQLLMVPRLSATLSIVVILILIFGKVSYDQGFLDGLSVTLFPIVIITMVIERVAVVWEEVGAGKAVLQFCWSMAAAVLGYAVMMHQMVQYWVLAFPELLLVVLALLLLCGRYTGYRLTELYRFRTILKGR